jgi:hypothetical protein
MNKNNNTFISKVTQGLIIFKNVFDKSFDETDFGKTRNRKVNYKDFIKIIFSEYAKHDVNLKNVVHAIENVLDVTITRNSVSDKFSQIPCNYFINVLNKLMTICSKNILQSKNGKLLNMVSEIEACDSSIFKLDKRLKDTFKHYASKNCKNLSALKIFTKLNLKTMTPTYICIEEGKTSEKAFLPNMKDENTLYITDLGYYKHEQLCEWTKNRIYFCTKVYPTAKIKIEKVIKGHDVLIGMLTKDVKCMHFASHKHVKAKAKIFRNSPGYGREDQYYGQEVTVVGFKFGKEIYWYICNLPEDFPIEELYKYYKFRWLIEIFFKLLKSGLNSKNIIFYNKNSVKNWLYMQIIYYLLGMMILKEYLGHLGLYIEDIKLLNYVTLISQYFDDILKKLLFEQNYEKEVKEFLYFLVVDVTKKNNKSILVLKNFLRA